MLLLGTGLQMYIVSGIAKNAKAMPQHQQLM